MARPVLMSDEDLYQLTGSWEDAAALRDEQNNAINQYDWSQPAAVTAPVAEAPVVETPASGLSAVTNGKSVVLEDASAPEVPEVTAPTTGALTQAITKPSDTEIVKFLTDNPTVSDADIATIMKTTGLNPADIARATGANVADVTTRFEAATQPIGALTRSLTPEVVDADASIPATTALTAEQKAELATKAETPAKPATVKAVFQGKSYDLNESDVNKVKAQILAQGTTSKWTGEGFGSADANAEAMAKNLVASGVKDINQVGLIDKKVDVEVRPDGNGGFVDAQGKTVDPSLVTTQEYGGEGGGYTTYTAPVGTQKVIGNKDTGEALIRDYNETDKAGTTWSGTYAGKGNTAFRTSFTADGKPIFYTTGASSNDLVKAFADDPILGKVATAAAAYFGGPAGVAALQVLLGKSVEDIAKGALLTYLGGEVAGNVSSSTDLINTFGADAAKVIGKTAGQVVSSEGKADILSSFIGNGIDVGTNTLLNNIDGFKDLSAGEKAFVTNVAKTTIQNGGNLSMDQLVDAGIAAATTAVKAAKTDTISTAIKADKTVNDAVTTQLDKALTFDATGSTDVNAASQAADAAGYGKFTFDGKTYTIDNNNAANTIKELEADALKTNTAANLKGGEFEGVDAQAAATAKANNTVIGNNEADTLEEAQALAKSRNPTGSQFTFGGQTYNMTASDAQMKNAVLEAKLSEATTAADAKKIALAELGANVSFKWTDANGKEQTLVTASTPVTTANSANSTANATITNYVNDKLSKNLTSAEFNPADLTKDEMSKFVSTYANATDAQKATLLKGADSMTFKVIDTLLKQTAALNPTGAGDVAAPAGSTTLKAWDKGSIATAVDVAKAAGNVAAADIAGLGVRGTQFLGDLMGQDTNSFAGVQNLLVNDKDKSMSKLVGNEKVIAGGIASGIESAVAWTIGGPMAGVASIAGVVANNSWVEGANAGLSVTDNAKRTAAMTALEVAGEMLGIPGMKVIMKGIPVTGSISEITNALTRAGAGLLNENASELLTTIAQFSVDKFASFGLNKNATFDDFQTALKDTIIATTAAVGTSSGISTATRAASGANTTQIADADRTAVSPDTSLLTSGASFGAKVGDTSNQGVNQVSSEAIDFNKLDPSKQTTILDSLRSNIANIGLSAALTLGSLANATEVETYVNNSIQTAASTGANVETAINTSVSGSINSAINNKVSTETAISSAVSSAVTSAVNNNVNTTTAINSAVTSAVNTASTSAASTTAAVTTAVDSAVSTAISTSVANNTLTAATVNTAVNTAVNSAVTAAVANNVSTTTAVNTAVTAAVTAAVTNNVSVADAVTAAVASVTNLNVNVAAVTALATNIANETLVKNDLVNNINTLIGVTTTPVTPITPVTPPPPPPPPPSLPPPPVVTPPVVEPPVVIPPVVVPPVVTPPPTTTSSKTTTASSGMLPAVMMAGDIARLPPQMLKAYMTQDKFVDPLAQLHALQENTNAEKIQSAPQVKTQEPDMPDQGTWKYGNAPDDLDTLFAEDKVAPAFKAGGYVSPLQMASGGAMPLPLLVKSGGALGAMPRPDGRLDFRHGAHVAGDGDGQSDDIKAMLADGEFVFPADVVSALGNGSTKAGSDKLYEMMHSIRERARSKKPKDLPPPALKSPLDYLKKR